MVDGGGAVVLLRGILVRGQNLNEEGYLCYVPNDAALGFSSSVDLKVG